MQAEVAENLQSSRKFSQTLPRFPRCSRGAIYQLVIFCNRAFIGDTYQEPEARSDYSVLESELFGKVEPVYAAKQRLHQTFEYLSRPLCCFSAQLGKTLRYILSFTQD